MKTSNIHIAWYITIGVFIFHFLPYFLFPGDAYIRIHDTLEGEWIWLHVLNETNTAWNFSSNAVIEPIMNGLPRSTMPTGLSVMMVMVKLFGTYWGYVVNYLLVHIVGFLAMYLFLRTHIFKDNENKSYAIYVSLIFSLIPVYTPFGLSVMSQPTLIHIFLLALKSKAKYYHYILLVLFPLYSSIVWMGIPLLMFVAMFWIYIAIRKKKLFPQYILSGLALTISYALVNYTIFQLIFDPPAGFVSHRQAYNLYMFSGPDILTSIVDIIHQFFTIHYHAGTMLTLPILLLGLIVYKKGNTVLRNTFWIIMGIVLFQAFYNFFEYYIGDKIGFVKSFRLNRMNILLPVLWISGLALIIKELKEIHFLKKIIPAALICIALTTTFGNDEILNNYRRIVGVYHLPTFKEYMAPDQFAEIKKYIGEDPKDYRVACIGMNPSILQYNGFYTLDGLQSVYDLNYKKEFRKIFANELEKDEEIKQYFDGWGNRCYIYSSDLGNSWNSFIISKYIGKQKRHIYKEIDIQLDSKAFIHLAGKYLITSIEIKSPEKSGLKMLKDFGISDLFWHLYLYKPIDETEI